MLAGVILATALIHILADAAGDLSNPCLHLSTGIPAICFRPALMQTEASLRVDRFVVGCTQPIYYSMRSTLADIDRFPANVSLLMG